ncbi:UNVERIFIED_CONTAM: hypothetical protein GTU68_065028 [Idotea baltica]|nr:hypothetical protein [Idotea baltica]
MDPEAFLEMANQVTKLKMYPYFDIAHCVICCLYVREDLGSGSLPFSRKHPLANWISSMITIFAGGFLSNWLLGEPILGAIKNNQQLVLATVVWYAIFYSPFDVGYKIGKFLPLKVLAAGMKEVYRVKKINDGVVHAAKIFPNGYLIMLMIGTIKGNGSGFLKILERLFRGVWTPNAVEILQPTFPTKASIAAALIFVLDKKTDLISAPHALVYFAICIFFVYFKLSSLLLGIHDPFVPFENLFCGIFMGGIWDSLSRTLGGSKAAAAEKTGEAAKNA